MKKNSHLETAAAYIAVAESGDSKRLAYEKAADEILAAMTENPMLTVMEIGAHLGKGRDWVAKLLKWRKEGDRDLLPFAHAESQRRYVERTLPSRTEDRVEMAEKLLADRRVAEQVVERGEVGARYVAIAKSAKDAEWMAKQRENKPAEIILELQQQVPMLVEKLQDIHADFRAMVPDLKRITNLSDRRMLTRMIYDFRGTLDQWLEALSDPADVIDIKTRELS